MTAREAHQHIGYLLHGIYDKDEAGNIADLIIENLTGSRKITWITNPDLTLPEDKIFLLQEYIKRLQQHEPVQYILNQAWFYNIPLYVDKHVLIPRPETEELVAWVLEELKRNTLPAGKKLKILDMGTGSGCIAIALKTQLLASAEVWACDFSEQALAVARRNAERSGVQLVFVRMDFLDRIPWSSFPFFDVIVSNPPYISINEKDTLNANVTAYEPHEALFVPENDPLIFYNALADFGREKLNDGGAIFMELHENMSGPVTELFSQKGYRSTELREDMQGKIRMCKAIR